MDFQRLSIPDIVLITPEIFTDERGILYESYNAAGFESFIGYKIDFVQDNHSHSFRNVLRGLHYQLPPKAQGKIVRVTKGEVFDVAVDLRRSSASFGQWVGANLSADNRQQMWIPEGFAHGFLVLSAEAELVYKTTNFYAPQYERSVIWDDKDLDIAWPLGGGQMPILSAKDKGAKPFDVAETFDK